MGNKGARMVCMTKRTRQQATEQLFQGESFRTFEDGSGTACVLFSEGYGFACHYIGGEVRLNGLSDYGSRYANERAAAIVRARFERLIAERTTPEWRALNVAMYTEEVRS